MPDLNQKSSQNSQNTPGGKNGKLPEGLTWTVDRVEDGRAGAAETADVDKLPRGFVDSTSQVVFQAAAILEEEIAAGIVAAKEVENRLIKSSATPSGTRNSVLRRFRKDLHEVVDVILDVIDVAVDQPDILRKSTAKTRGAPKQQKQEVPASGDGCVPLLKVPRLGKAGETIAVAMLVENDGGDSAAEFGFLSTDLVNANGDRISARQVKFSPSRVSFGTDQAQAITVAVAVPQEKPSGTYVGVIQTTRGGRPQAVLNVQVG